MTKTYTRSQIMERLGLSKNSRSAFLYLCREYPEGFVIVKPGKRGRGNSTLYDAQAVERFVKWRNRYKKAKP